MAVQPLQRLTVGFPFTVGEMHRPVGSRAARALIVVATFGIAVATSFGTGAPDELPPVAFSWTVLFHVERAAALLAAVGMVLLVGWRATEGIFPFRFGHVEYATSGETGNLGPDMEARICCVEKRLDEVERTSE